MNARRHGPISAPTNLRLQRAVRLAAIPADAIGYRLNPPFGSVIWVTHGCEWKGLLADFNGFEDSSFSRRAFFQQTPASLSPLDVIHCSTGTDPNQCNVIELQ